MSEYNNNDIFDMAGIRKSTLLDRWEFLWGGSGNTDTSYNINMNHTKIITENAEKKKLTSIDMIDKNQDNNIKLSDNIDLDELKLSSPITINQSILENNSKKLSGSVIDTIPSDNNNNENITTTTNKKKKKKKKSGKATIANSASTNPSVKWGCVEQICFTRSIGYDRIPTRGYYPIALGQEVERVTCTVDQLFYVQQLKLMEKAQICGIATMQVPVHVNHTCSTVTTQNVTQMNNHNSNHSINSNTINSINSNSNNGSSNSNSNEIEKSPSRNKKTKPRSRSNSVTSINSDTTTTTTNHSNNNTSNSSNMIVVPIVDYSATLETRQFDYKSSTNPLFHSIEEDKRIEMLTHINNDNIITNKNRSNSIDNTSTSILSSHHHTTTNSNNNSSNSNNSSTSSSNNIFTEVNNEIKLVKNIRGMSGCDCKHVKADKLSIAKLKSELITNGYYINYDSKIEEVSKLSKTELLSKVKEVLKYCDMCVTNECECVQQGIQCSAQLCGCLRSGYHPGESQSCMNPEGRDLYDPQRVKEYRLKILSDLSLVTLETI